MDNTQSHPNPLYTSMLRDISSKDLVHVLVRRLTRIREVHAARIAITEPITVGDATLSEILVALQQQIQNTRPRKVENDEIINKIENVCTTAIQADNAAAAQDAIRVIQDEINKLRNRNK